MAINECVRKRQSAPVEVSDAESLRIMRILDEARRQLGVSYPPEERAARKVQRLKIAAITAATCFVLAAATIRARQ